MAEEKKSQEATTKSVPKKKKKNIPAKLVKKKPYLEFITAFLSIPVLITVMLLNVNSLKNLNAKPTPTPAPGAETQSGFYSAPFGTQKPTIALPTGSANTSCVKGLGDIRIDTPSESDTVTDNPVIVTIFYDDSTYCGAAWSYRINGGTWSGYDNRSVALYNLPSGQVIFELRVRSIVTGDEKNITRKFTYKSNTSSLYPTGSQASSSAK